MFGVGALAKPSATWQSLLITHTGNNFWKARFNPLLLHGSYRLSILLLAKGQHKFGLYVFSPLFLQPKHQTCSTNGSSYFQHLCKSNQNGANGRWCHRHMQRKSHFDFIFWKRRKRKVKVYDPSSQMCYCGHENKLCRSFSFLEKKKTLSKLCPCPLTRFSIC